MSEEDIKTKARIDIFRGNKLSGMAKLCFENSPFAIINNAYPGKYRITDFWRSPNELWIEELFAKDENTQFKAIDLAYPGKFKPWDFKHVPTGYWKKPANRIEAMRYVFLEKLKFNEDELLEKVSQELFTQHGLMGMLNHHYNGSTKKAINNL